MKPSCLIRTLGLLTGLLFIGVAAQAATTLTSVKTDKPILLSGVADNAWQKATPLMVTVDNLTTAEQLDELVREFVSPP